MKVDSRDPQEAFGFMTQWILEEKLRSFRQVTARKLNIAESGETDHLGVR